MREPLRVLHLVDSLARGGTERVAVELVNRLPREAVLPFLGTTRREGPLAGEVAPDVGRLRCERRGPVGVAGLVRLRQALRRQRIDLVHAHSTSLFSALVARGPARGPGRRPAIVWHDHYGAHGLAERPAWLFRLAARRVAAVVAVEPVLAAWSRDRLGVPAERVVHLPNFVALGPDLAPAVDLPGDPGERIVCVANLRPQKDHATLLAAFALVARERPRATLLLVGAAPDPAARERLGGLIREGGAGERVVFLGERSDVPSILRASAVGVLASRSEGTPLALLEYGAAGVAVVATTVGGCPEVLDEGRAGVLVPPGDPAALAAGLGALLADPERRARLGEALRRRVEERYSERAVLPRLTALYAAVAARLRPD